MFVQCLKTLLCCQICPIDVPCSPVWDVEDGCPRVCFSNSDPYMHVYNAQCYQVTFLSSSPCDLLSSFLFPGISLWPDVTLFCHILPMCVLGTGPHDRRKEKDKKTTGFIPILLGTNNHFKKRFQAKVLCDCDTAIPCLKLPNKEWVFF